jgi:bifunctional non-homologous end joining protein LigD
VKTTGGKGLHVVAPVTRRREWDELKAFSRGVAEGLAREEPERFLATAAKADRGGRIYLDYLRNGWAATAVAPYSTRARPGAPVSLPVSWEELTAGVAPASLNVLTVPERMGQTPDPWAEMPTLRQGVTRAALSKVQGA